MFKLFHLIQDNSRLRTIATLLLMSAVCVLMVLLRVAWKHNITYIFLVWNLFLAWIPLVIAYRMHLYNLKKPSHRLVLLLPGLVWLLFFPNAPYIITDLKHIKGSDLKYLFDPMLFFAFALTGLMTGFISLYFIHEILNRLFNRLIGWLLLLSILGLTGYGIFLGRMLRWNSWDAFTHPLSLLKSIVHSLSPGTVAMTLMFAGVMFFFYLIIHSVIHLKND